VIAGVVYYMLLCWGGVVFAGLVSLTSLLFHMSLPSRPGINTLYVMVDRERIFCLEQSVESML